MMNSLCNKCGAYWECDHKRTPTLQGSPTTGDTVVINGKEYEPPKLHRGPDGRPVASVKRFTQAQVDATKEERRERNRRQAEELASKYRQPD